MLLVESYSTEVPDAELAKIRLELTAAAVLVILVGSGLGCAGRAPHPAPGPGRRRRRPQLGNGDLETRLPVQGKDEFADLAG